MILPEGLSYRRLIEIDDIVLLKLEHGFTEDQVKSSWRVAWHDLTDRIGLVHCMRPSECLTVTLDDIASVAWLP